MTDDEPASGPWGRRDGADRAAARRPARAGWAASSRAWLRTLFWVGCGAIGVAGGAALLRLFPGRLASGEDWLHLSMQLGFLVLVATGLAAARLPWRITLKYAAIWGALISVLVIGVVYRTELVDAGYRVRSALIPSYAVASGPRELVLSRSEGGHYAVVGRVNGTPVTFMIDTGASDIVLSPEDARRAGLNPSALRYDRVYGTANGAGRGAATTVGELDVGPIRLRNVEVAVNGAPMGSSLLGMSFVRRLQSMRFEGDRLILTWR